LADNPAYNSDGGFMNIAEIKSRLAGGENHLQKLGVESLALFDSAARREYSEGSDVDLLVTFNKPISLFDYGEIQVFLEKLLGGAKVDLVIRDGVIEELKEAIYREAVPCL